MNVQQDYMTVIKYVQSLVMDGITAPVKTDSLLTRISMHVKVKWLCMYTYVLCVLCGI